MHIRSIGGSFDLLMGDWVDLGWKLLLELIPNSEKDHKLSFLTSCQNTERTAQTWVGGGVGVGVR